MVTTRHRGVSVYSMRTRAGSIENLAFTSPASFSGVIRVMLHEN